MKQILILFFIYNLITLVLMLLDKLFAKIGARRIPESSLLLAAATGGSLGAMLGMYLFRHKTRHRRFRIGLPVMFLVHLVLAACAFYFL